jgi:hypothetical protein
MTPPPDWVPELPGEGVLPARFTGGSPHFSPNLATCYRLSDVQSRDALYVDDHFRFLADVNGLPDYRTVLRFPPGQTREEAIRSVVDGPPTDLERFWFGNGMATGIEPRGFESPLLDLMGVRYLLFSPEYRGPDPPADRFELSASGPGDVWRIYRRRGPLGRAFVVHGSEVHAERSALEARRRDPAFDWRSTVLLDRGPVRPPAAAAPGEEVEVVEHAPNRVRLRARLAAEGFVVLADTWFPGWRVRVGGRPAEALEAYGAFRAVPLPAGEHLVEFRYLPASFLAGVALAGAAALGLAGYGVRAFRVRGAPARAPLPYGSG